MVKPLKLAGIFGIVILTLTVVFMISLVSISFFVFSSIEIKGGLDDSLQQVEQQIQKVFNITAIFISIIYLLNIGFLFGFVALGRRFNNKMLFVSAWIFIVLSILGFILTLGFYATGNLYSESQTTQTSSIYGNFFKQKASQIPVMGTILNMFGDAGFWPLLILFIIGGLTLKLIFAIGLIRLKKNEVPLADLSGWFEIGSIIINIMGFLATIMETIMFFKASKKFETEDSQMSYQ